MLQYGFNKLNTLVQGEQEYPPKELQSPASITDSKSKYHTPVMVAAKRIIKTHKIATQIFLNKFIEA
jgi:hypothetical protein